MNVHNKPTAATARTSYMIVTRATLRRMEHLARHVGDLLNDAIARESAEKIFALIDKADDITFAGSGNYGTTYFVTTGAQRVVIKTVVQFPPETSPEKWWSEEDNPAMSEALIGTYYYTGEWRNGYVGDAIPRFEDRSGAQFDSKADDPLPGLVNYTGFVILENEEVVSYYEALADTQRRTSAPVEEVDALLKTAKAVADVIAREYPQRLYVMILESGESGTLSKLAQRDPDFPSYAVSAITQLICTLHLLRLEDGFVHGDAGTANVVLKTLRGDGPTSVRYRVQNESDGVIHLKAEHVGDFPLFMFIDFGFSRFDQPKIAALDQMRELAESDGKKDEARLLSWVPEWRDPKVTVIGDMRLSHATDKHLFGIDMLADLATRLRKKTDSTPAAIATIWDIARFCVERLLLPIDALKPGMHEVPMFASEGMEMDYRVVYRAFFELVSGAVHNKAVDTFSRVMTNDIRDYTVGGQSMAHYTNAPNNIVYFALRFFPQTAVARWDEFRPFWTDSIFDSVRTVERKRGRKRGLVALVPGVEVGEGSSTVTVTPLRPELPSGRSEKRRTLMIAKNQAPLSGMKKLGDGISLL